MNNKKIHKRLLNDVAFEIPPADKAWKEMRGKLEKEEKRRGILTRWKRIGLLAIFCFLTGIAWWLLEISPITFKTDLSKETKKTTDTLALINKEKGNYDERNNILQKEKNAEKDKRAELPPELTPITPGKTGAQYLHTNRKSIKLKKNTLKKLPADETRSRHLFLNSGSDENDMAYSSNSRSKNNVDSSATQKKSINRPILDSSKRNNSEDETKIEKDDMQDIIIRLGLQWTAQLPIPGSYKYFTGPNGSSQPYRLLLPGIWLSLQTQKMLFNIEVAPFATSVLANKPYATNSTLNGPDIILESRTLHKIFGVTTGIGFDYNIAGKWWTGGRVTGNFWSTGTGTVKGIKENTGGTTTIAYEHKFTPTPGDWAGFSRFQLGTGAQILYRQSKWEAGIQFDYHIGTFVDKAGQKNKTGTAVFIRLPLYMSGKSN